MGARHVVVAIAMAAVTMAAAVALVGCGSESVEQVAPPRVDPALAPESVGEGLSLHRNDEEETVAAFANAGERSLAADGAIWEVRRADRLVGTLQITTVLPKVDLTEGSVRESIVRQIISGSLTRIRIDDVEVYTSVVNDKAVFVWFGADLYEVLQLKDRSFEDDYEAIATDVIRHQSTVSAWKPLPPDVIEAT